VNDPQILLLDHRDPVIAGRINELQQASYAVESRLINYDRIPYLVQGAEGIITSEEIFIGCQVGNELAGLTSYEKEDPRSMTICRMVISPLFFRRGLALRLLEFLEELDPMIRYIYVQTAEKNHPAIHLYKKAGYQLIREFATPDGLSIVRLKKTIGLRTDSTSNAE
jgi:ribosomal protein S18 acetylase RimI-like enzyme